MSKDRIQEIRERWGNYISFLDERKSVALCNPQQKKVGWYFAICSNCDINIDFIFSNFDFMEISIRNVQLQPIFEELADSLQDKTLISRVWSYASLINYEIFVEGVEADFGFLKNFITYYLVAAYIAAFLEPSGEKRLHMYRKIKKMYTFRSKAVHGDTLKNNLINDHIIETKSLLRQLIVNIVQNNSMPTTDDFDKKLFT